MRIRTPVRQWFVIGAAVLGIGGCFSGQRGKGGDAARSISSREDPSDPQSAFKAEVRAHLAREDFDALDRMSAELSRTKARFPGGDWKLYRFQGALGAPAGGDDAPDEEWERHIAALRRWLTRRPDSIAAGIALSDACVGYGWKARGSGFADSVTPEGWRLLAQRLEPAESVLVEAGRRGVKNPQWYAAMIDLGRVEGWDNDRVQTLFDEAIAAEPLYLHLYSAMARHLLPRWQGNEGDWERLAEESAERLGGREGSVVYSHIAWQISKFYRGHDFFDQNRVSWPRVKQGFIDREALYGPSLRNLNGFCMLAGAAADRETTRQLLARIGDHWDAEIWKERRYFDGYRKWALEDSVNDPSVPLVSPNHGNAAHTALSDRRADRAR